MVHISEKIIKGKKYKYLVNSIRLPDGTLKKISKLIKTGDVKNLKKEYSGVFLQKEKDLKLQVENEGLQCLKQKLLREQP